MFTKVAELMSSRTWMGTHGNDQSRLFLNMLDSLLELLQAPLSFTAELETINEQCFKNIFRIRYSENLKQWPDISIGEQDISSEEQVY